MPPRADLTPSETQVAAVHEAGHVVCALTLGVHFSFVTLHPPLVQPGRDSDPQDKMIFAMAGGVADHLRWGWPPRFSDSDLGIARHCAGQLGGDESIWLKWAERQAAELLGEPEAARAVDAIATELRLWGRLSYREARDVWRGGRGVAGVGGRVGVGP